MIHRDHTSHSIYIKTVNPYSHLSNNRGGWNKRGGWKIFMKSINMEGGFYFEEGEIFQIIREMTEY